MEDPDLFTEKKWRISKKEKPNSSYSLSKSSSVRIIQQHSPPHSSNLRRSSSTRHQPSEKSGFTRKCKEQKARFYIMKRCVAMLVRWRNHDDK